MDCLGTNVIFQKATVTVQNNLTTCEKICCKNFECIVKNVFLTLEEHRYVLCVYWQ